MTQEEYNQELSRLQSLIRNLENRRNHLVVENERLTQELVQSLADVEILTSKCRQLDDVVFEEVDYLSDVVGQADLEVKHIFDALNELTAQFFTYKRLSTASKNITQYTDEYYTKFHYYNELRRITLGYVVGLDANIVSSEVMRKKVEKAYLQNTEYWLAYCITAVMLWASNEKEAANRAVSKALSINYFNSCLFFLLVNLRFNRIEAAKKWYVNYLDHADRDDLGDEWQYLLQAYLFGVFGTDEKFQALVMNCFKDMVSQLEMTTVDFAKKFTSKALAFAQLYLHKTDKEFITIRRNSENYKDLMDLLSTAEKNGEIAKYYDDLTQVEAEEGENLAQRIENVLYSLINDYDDQEYKVVKNIKLNEAIVAAKGDMALAQAKTEQMFLEREQKKNFGDLLRNWAFSEDGQTDVSVKRFSISFMKDAIAKGYEEFANDYRKNEPDTINFEIDGCKINCNENQLDKAEEAIKKHYDKNKFMSTLKDKLTLIFILITLGGLALCGIGAIVIACGGNMIAIGILLSLGAIITLVGIFLICRHAAELAKTREEKKKKAIAIMKQALGELAEWRQAYKEADAENANLIKVFEKY